MHVLINDINTRRTIKGVILFPALILLLTSTSLASIQLTLMTVKAEGLLNFLQARKYLFKVARYSAY